MDLRKVFGISVAIMLAVPFFVVVTDYDTDATVSDSGLATYGFYYYNGTGWSAETTGVGYNAYSALNNSGLDVEMKNHTIPTSYGTTINPEWGMIVDLKNMADENGSWYVYYYSESQSKWVQGINATGFYQAYSDYDPMFKTANMAFYFGASAPSQTTINSLPTTNLREIVNVQNNDTFKVTFTLSVAPGMQRPGTITQDAWTTMNNNLGEHVGYGSNAYLALKSIIPQIVSDDTVMNDLSTAIDANHYSYVDSIYGVGSTTTANADNTTTYTYWSSYVGNNYASYMLGYYTPIVDANVGSEFNNQDTFSLSYDTLTY